MAKYALVSKATSKVVNIIVWDGAEPYTVDAACDAVEVTPGTTVGMDWSYSEGEFIDPNPPEEEEAP